MPGPTFLSYTPDGLSLVTVGQNNAIRVFQSGSDEEPVVIDNCQDANTAVVATVRPSVAARLLQIPLLTDPERLLRRWLRGLHRLEILAEDEQFRGDSDQVHLAHSGSCPDP